MSAIVQTRNPASQCKMLNSQDQCCDPESFQKLSTLLKNRYMSWLGKLNDILEMFLEWKRMYIFNGIMNKGFRAVEPILDRRISDLTSAIEDDPIKRNECLTVLVYHEAATTCISCADESNSFLRSTIGLSYGHLILDLDTCNKMITTCKDIFTGLYFVYALTLGMDFAIRQNVTQVETPEMVLSGNSYKKHIKTESFMHWMRSCIIEKLCLGWCQAILAPIGFDYGKVFIDMDVLHNRTSLMFRLAWESTSNKTAYFEFRNRRRNRNLEWMESDYSLEHIESNELAQKDELQYLDEVINLDHRLTEFENSQDLGQGKDENTIDLDEGDFWADKDNGGRMPFMFSNKERIGAGLIDELGSDRVLSGVHEMIDIYTIFSKSEVKRIDTIKVGKEQGILDKIMKSGLAGLGLGGIIGVSLM